MDLRYLPHFRVETTLCLYVPPMNTLAIALYENSISFASLFEIDFKLKGREYKDMEKDLLNVSKYCSLNWSQ